MRDFVISKGLECSNPTPQEIAHHLIDNIGNSLADKSKYIIVILGRPGPRGKTWLRNALRQNGFNVVDISEDICWLISYCGDEENHFIVDVPDRRITIVLNAEWCK